MGARRATTRVRNLSAFALPIAGVALSTTAAAHFAQLDFPEPPRAEEVPDARLDELPRPGLDDASPAPLPSPVGQTVRWEVEPVDEFQDPWERPTTVEEPWIIASVDEFEDPWASEDSAQITSALELEDTATQKTLEEPRAPSRGSQAETHPWLE